ncbi:MAG: hypothetical protein JWO59_2751 [Chloroflexi bacterium]|nr:hypothetical protein [Chloroflexota bacterium]
MPKVIDGRMIQTKLVPHAEHHGLRGLWSGNPGGTLRWLG